MKTLVAFIVFIFVALVAYHAYGAERKQSNQSITVEKIFKSPIRELKVLTVSEANSVLDSRLYRVTNFLDGVFIERSLKEIMRIWGTENQDKIRYQIFVRWTDRVEFTIKYFILK